MHETERNSGQRGFVLVTSLVLLGLLTLMSLAMFYSGRVATQTSSTAQSSTEAYYYTETAVNYIAWALANDAEFDNHTYTGTYVAAPFGDPPKPDTPSPANAGDFNELLGYTFNPGPTGEAGASAVDTPGPYTAGQLMYFDNSPMSRRHLCLQDATLFNNCVDVTVDPATRVEPSMNKISAQLPRYIKLDIAADGSITPSIPSLPHHATPVVGQDIPENGAIVWMTAGDPNPANANHDIEIFPLAPTVPPADPYPGVDPPSACMGGTLPNCPCDAINDAANYAIAVACDANTGQWLTSYYTLVIYAIGYVNGKPSHILRSVIDINPAP